jgi:hypothetical protein
MLKIAGSRVKNQRARRWRNQDVPGISAIHYALRHVDTWTRDADFSAQMAVV